ncbi:HAD family hydrolase [Vibrio genomosp. F10]|nr:HAD family hydrolase [Vibrio genomosp. F10]
MSKSLYVFDMDETLFSADCSMLWNAFLVEQGIVSSDDFIKEDQRLMALYSAGELDMEDYLAFAMSPLLDMDKSEVNELVEKCVTEQVMPRFYPQAKALIEQLNNKGTKTIVISATVNFIVKAVAKRICVNTAMGIDLVVKGQCYTREIEGIPTYRQGKVERLNQWLLEQETSYDDIHFYTDSINDLPLCERADRVYLVNPCPQLLAHAGRPNWQTLNWTL